MGKKGKGKVTGTPEVVKFKTEEATKRYWSVLQILGTGWDIPWVTDASDDADGNIRKYLTFLGMLAELAGMPKNKTYRYALHHPLALPQPEPEPWGYPFSTIVEARKVKRNMDKPAEERLPNKWMVNDVRWELPVPLVEACCNFLQLCDDIANPLQLYIEIHVKGEKADFKDGIDAFKDGLRRELTKLDDAWVSFEKMLLEEKLRCYTKVLADVSAIVHVETALTEAEAANDVRLRGELEVELLDMVQALTHALLPETAQSSTPTDVREVPMLAEACLFYDARLPDHCLLPAKLVVKAYFELRHLITMIPTQRLAPDLKDNKNLLRTLKAFHAATTSPAAVEALRVAAGLPRLADAKTSNWMTRAAMLGM